ncbi:hypothetical protein [Moheibacter sp.]|uniref:hypothetical protein n=1 Tax=Moheibacter sp. TaxID=1965316 RepID=UPI003C73C3BD
MKKTILFLKFVLLTQYIFAQNSTNELKLNMDGFSSVQFDISNRDIFELMKKIDGIKTSGLKDLGWDIKMASRTTLTSDVYTCYASKKNISDLTMSDGEKEPLSAFIYFEIFLSQNTIDFKVEIKELYNQRFKTDNLYIFFDRDDIVLEYRKEDLDKLENEIDQFVSFFIKQVIY